MRRAIAQLSPNSLEALAFTQLICHQLDRERMQRACRISRRIWTSGAFLRTSPGTRRGDAGPWGDVCAD